MTDSSPLDRAKENATEIASTVVTGVWLAALFLDLEWWLPLMLFGYVVVVPVVSMLFGEEEGEADGSPETDAETAREDTGARGTDEDGVTEGNADAIDRLRTRYAEGDLTDEQFERKLDRLLETETPEDAEEWRERERERDRPLERDRS
ncbi:Short C-terminal domain-containing protein [Halorubrum aquaticum]|uniref:Short C-terminal domain-containing protein n=1 Tax=Halorubrum aquaticum TaxID=387340 RepID=A0A1I3BAT4_9EURY|nr:SHOCT domain-containing protein [Halorubrum aquaticum]SFH59362.1 Short C-terminal domain-containing protein [Halorubrum aquaticum]